MAGKLFRNEVVLPAEVETFPRYEGRSEPLRAASFVADGAWLATVSGLLLVAGWRRLEKA